MQQQVDPFRIAGNAFAIEKIERLLETVEIGGGPIARLLPDDEIIGRKVDARQDNDFLAADVAQKWNVVRGIVAVSRKNFIDHRRLASASA